MLQRGNVTSLTAIDLASHVQCVHETTQLVLSLASLLQEASPHKQEAALQAVRCVAHGSLNDAQASPSDAPSHDQALATWLVSQYLGSASPKAKASLAGLQQLMSPIPGGLRDLSRRLAAQTLLQANQSRSACVDALDNLLSARNCFTVLRLAYAHDRASLWASAHHTALACFSEAVQLDADGLAALPLDLLVHVLRLDALQVKSEMPVFYAVVLWVERDMEARAPHFQQLLGSVVRLQDMSIEELGIVDATALVLRNPECTKLVAQAYLTKYLAGGAACCSRGAPLPPLPALSGALASPEDAAAVRALEAQLAAAAFEHGGALPGYDEELRDAPAQEDEELEEATPAESPAPVPPSAHAARAPLKVEVPPPPSACGEPCMAEAEEAYDPDEEFGYDEGAPAPRAFVGSVARALLVSPTSRPAPAPPAGAARALFMSSAKPVRPHNVGVGLGAGPVPAGGLKRALFASVASPNGGRRTPWAAPPGPHAALGATPCSALKTSKKLRFD